MLPFQLASRLDAIAPFHVMELAKMAADLERQGRSVIQLGIGEPDFTAPPLVVQAAQQAMAEGKVQYTAATGLPALREAIAQYYLNDFGVSVDPARIIVTAGASGALLLACAALVEKGAEVLMPDPSYPCNRHFLAAFDGIAKMIPSGSQDRFQLSDAMVQEHWGSSTRGVLLASPSNPTGTAIVQDELAKIMRTVRGKGGFVIVDEIYQGLTYDQRPCTALSLSEDAIVINSFSKYFHMTGWRLGWLVVPPHMVTAIEKLAQNLFICPSSIAQYAGIACFAAESRKIYEDRRLEFKQRRNYIVSALRELGFGIPVRPDGAFYVYANCTAFSDDADQFTRDLLNQAGVVMVPGLDFGTHAPRDHVRITYATSLANLQEAMSRVRTHLQN